jgi:hypothetical protein
MYIYIAFTRKWLPLMIILHNDSPISLKDNIYICNCFLLHNTVMSNAYLSPHRYLFGVNRGHGYVTVQQHVVTDRVKFQHFV